VRKKIEIAATQKLKLRKMYEQRSEESISFSEGSGSGATRKEDVTKANHSYSEVVMGKE
jgi:hypothetical protein